MKKIRRDSILTVLKEIRSRREAYKNVAKISGSEILTAHYNGFEECLALLEKRDAELVSADNKVGKSKIN